ncbi:TetR/AcrR family transcriptional regulator [bacterium]|nr:TetR/AcrR family transcriptional regulator [bacterium]
MTKKETPAAGDAVGARKERKLEHLLSVAAGLMAEQGYAQTTIRDVSRRTGYSLAGMYYYFENKEDLLYQIQHRTFASLLAAQERVVAGPATPEEKLRQLVDNHLVHFSRYASELKVCTFELQTLEADRYGTIAELRRRYFKCVASVIAGIIGGSDPAAVRRYTLLIFGMLNWIFMWYDPARDGDVSTLGEEMMALVAGGLPGWQSDRARKDGV